MKLQINLSNSDYEKFKLVMIFNKTMAEWKRGVEAVELLEKSYKHDPELESRHKNYIEKLTTYRNAQEKLDCMIQKMALELLEKYEINTYGVDYCNPYEAVKFKMEES